MEDFRIAGDNLESRVKIQVSPVCYRDGKQYAFVSFSDGEKSAEGRIPECELIRNEGFSQEEGQKLQDYMKRELSMLKKMAAGTDVLKALMKS